MKLWVSNCDIYGQLFNEFVALKKYSDQFDISYLLFLQILAQALFLYFQRPCCGWTHWKITCIGEKFLILLKNQFCSIFYFSPKKEDYEKCLGAPPNTLTHIKIMMTMMQAHFMHSLLKNSTTLNIIWLTLVYGVAYIIVRERKTESEGIRNEKGIAGNVSNEKFCVDWLKLCYAIAMKKRRRMITPMTGWWLAMQGKKTYTWWKENIEHAAYRYNCKLQFWFHSSERWKENRRTKRKEHWWKYISNTLHVTCKLSYLYWQARMHRNIKVVFSAFFSSFFASFQF